MPLLGYAADLHGEADILQNCPLHQKIEALEDHGDGAAGLTEFPFRQGGHLLAVYYHGAAGGPLQQVDAPYQGALSGTGEADDAEDLAGLDVQVDVLQCGDSAFAAAEGFGQMLNLNDGFTHAADAPFRIFGTKKRP